ncbi:MAG: DUF5916 domain-containing protein [Bacteroidetes bacterium]|nr:DUF5916 domain-containing protein [Bacteroidota bacterium]
MLRKLIIVILYLLPLYAFAQKSKPDTLSAYYTEEKISIDGFFTESAWQKATRISNFTQRDPEEGKPVSESTYAAILYNKNTLYIGLWGYDTHPEKILAKDMARDGRWGTSDNFIINISTFNDMRNSFLFVVTPSGLRGDALITDEGTGFNEDWNGVWDVEVQRNDSGWFAEIVIPFSTLKFPDLPVQVWGFNIERNIKYKKEEASWQGWSRDYSAFKISQGGTLSGLQHIKGNQIAEIKPFLTAGFQEQGNSGFDKTLKVGGDVNISFTPTTKLNLTVNTDFSQVESDRIPINLTRFSVFMPEKRAFFIENKGLFEFNMNSGSISTFYSRRIGIDNGFQIPIIGGLKLTGKEKNTNFGILSMQTAEKSGFPSVNYTVIRVKQEISKQTSVGFITTARNEKGHYNYVYGVDLNYTTSRLFTNKNFIIGGSLAQSQTEDASKTKNLAYELYLKYPNDFITYQFLTNTVQSAFNPEIGFMQRGNYNLYNTLLEIKPRPAFIPWIRQLFIKPVDITYYVSDDYKSLETAQYVVKPLGITTKSGETMAVSYIKTFENLGNNFRIFDTITIPKAEYWFNHYQLDYSSYQSRKFYISGYLGWGDFFSGTKKVSYLSVCWYPSHHFNITADWTYNDIQLKEGSFKTHEVGSRVEYAFTPKLNSSIYGQWNNASKEVLLNYRINWIPKVGSDFYFVLNQRINTRNNKIEFGDFTVLAKFIWYIVV